MLDKINIFTKGFDNNTNPLPTLRPASIEYFKKFNEKGYYVFVENRIHHDWEISGEFNGHELKFQSVSSGLFKAEIDYEDILDGQNSYKIILNHKYDKHLGTEINERQLVADLYN